MGCGSGVILKTLSLLLEEQKLKSLYFAMDISNYALDATARVFEDLRFGSLEKVQIDLFSGIKQDGLVDICIFNPPYVVTPSEEVSSSIFARTWAGGEDGVEVTNLFIQQVRSIMADKGILYLLCIKENKPEILCQKLLCCGFQFAKIISKRIAFNESLFIIKGIC